MMWQRFDTLTVILICLSSFSCSRDEKTTAPGVPSAVHSSVPVTAPSSAAPVPSPPTFTADDFVRAARANDQSFRKNAKHAPADLPQALDAARKTMPVDARKSAAGFLCEVDTIESNEVLLKMAADIEWNVEMVAVNCLREHRNVPSADAIIAAFPRIQGMRSLLYEILMKRPDPTRLDAVRQLVAKDGKDGHWVREDGELAAIAFGGEEERNRFAARIVAAPQPFEDYVSRTRVHDDDVMRVSKHLILLNDKRMAKALLPWLSNATHFSICQSHFCPWVDTEVRDVAVWTAYQLGVPLDYPLTALAHYHPAVHRDMYLALSALPD
ncbi:hypothetical protein LVJ94_00395 [Pendulispora rubella]|uniref:HEAT repeat domain-containing protein n=1 Tax=Pendulispora rubella TaxID=2741070 RepID=A0ABZ2L446_9BACT